MLIFGFDPGQTTGYAIIDTERIHGDRWEDAGHGILDAGAFSFSQSEYQHKRMGRLYESVGGVIQHGIAKRVEALPDPASGSPADELVALVERPAWAGTYSKKRNPQAVAGLNRTIGALLMALAVQKLNRVELVKAAKIPKAERRLAAIAALRSADKTIPPDDEHDVFDALYLALDWITRDEKEVVA